MTAQRKVPSHVCPPWMSWSLDNLFRVWLQNPRRILSPYVRDGDIVLDAGCGPGFFTIALAELAGVSGQVVAADIQAWMLEKVRMRAERAGVLPRIRLHLGQKDHLGVAGSFDFALAFWMAHEVPDPQSFFTEIAGILKPEGRFLLVEPRFHVSRKAFAEAVEAAARAGLQADESPRIRFSHAALFRRKRRDPSMESDG